MIEKLVYEPRGFVLIMDYQKLCLRHLKANILKRSLKFGFLHFEELDSLTNILFNNLLFTRTTLTLKNNLIAHFNYQRFVPILNLTIRSSPSLRFICSQQIAFKYILGSPQWLGVMRKVTRNSVNGEHPIIV